MGGSNTTDRSLAQAGGLNAAPAGSPTSSITGAGGVAGAAQNANSAADLLSNSPASTGVEIQRRNAVVSDPRVRGYRAQQYLTIGDGGLFTPARLDLDTAITKFDPGSVRDIIVIKGPYSTLYGPGFSFLDIATLDSPRYLNGFDVRGRTASGYQTNGRRWDGLQSIQAGDANWGFRGTYNIQQGNDYESGDGTRVPNSYLSQNFNFALGFDLDENNSIELKGLRVWQEDLEFPGLYFDISRLDTAAYSLRYTLRNAGAFDRMTLDTWYNHTTADGDTRGGAKQAFVQKLLGVSFNPDRYERQIGNQFFGRGEPGILPLASPLSALASDPNANLFTDTSTSRFSVRTLGYRTAFHWGPEVDPWLTVGTDMNIVGQGLVENIRLNQVQGTSIVTGLPIVPGAPVTATQVQGIPNSNQFNPGLFFQANLIDGPRFRLRGGSRVDYVNSSSNPRLNFGNVDLFTAIPAPGVNPANRIALDPLVYSADPNNNDLTREYFLIAGFLQSEYRLDENWSVLAGIGHSQRPPSLTELYATGPFIGVLQTGTSRLIGDPNLDQEKLTQFDVGLRATYERAQFGINGFYALVEDYITYDANRLAPGITQVVFTNTDRATLGGAEIFAQWDATNWLTPFGSLSYVQGIDQTASDRRRPQDLDSSRRDNPLTLRRQKDTEPLPQIPPLESRLGFRIHEANPLPRWSVEFSARMVAGQESVARSLGEIATPGFTIFNVRGFWRITDNLLVTAGVENLGDRNYREHLDPISGNLLGVGPMLRPGTNFFFNTQITY